MAALGGAPAASATARSTDGAVVDFLVVGGWPAFDLADVGIVAGAALAVIFAR